jgi:hypothetical protein
MEDTETAAGSLVRTISQSMDDGRKETLKWLKDNNLATDDGTLLSNVRMHSDEVTGNVYYTKDGVFEDDDSGAAHAGAGGSSTTPSTAKLKRFFQTSPTGNLFNILGRLARSKETTVHNLIKEVFTETHAIINDIKHLAGDAVLRIGRKGNTRNSLEEDIHRKLEDIAVTINEAKTARSPNWVKISERLAAIDTDLQFLTEARGATDYKVQELKRQYQSAFALFNRLVTPPPS